MSCLVVSTILRERSQTTKRLGNYDVNVNVYLSLPWSYKAYPPEGVVSANVNERRDIRTFEVNRNTVVEFTQLHYWMRQMNFNAWGIQTRPLAAHTAHFVLKIFHLFHLHTGEPFLITPEGQLLGDSPNSRIG